MEASSDARLSLGAGPSPHQQDQGRLLQLDFNTGRREGPGEEDMEVGGGARGAALLMQDDSEAESSERCILLQ